PSSVWRGGGSILSSLRGQTRRPEDSRRDGRPSPTGVQDARSPSRRKGFVRRRFQPLFARTTQDQEGLVDGLPPESHRRGSRASPPEPLRPTTGRGLGRSLSASLAASAICPYNVRRGHEGRRTS